MKRIGLLVMSILFGCTSLMAQQERIETQRGNEALASGDVESAIEYYQKALEINPDYKEAIFNLGTSYQAISSALAEQIENIEDPQQKEAYTKQMQALSKQAAEQYEKVQELLDADEEINKNQYNLGNAQLTGGELEKSIEAYKEALRKNPSDEEARYNLAYAQHMKQQQQNQQQDQQQDQQQQDQQQQDQEQQQNQNQDKEQEQQPKDQQQQPNPQQMSKEEAEQLLEALKKQEKDLQEKLQKKKKGKPQKIEKDW